MSRTPDFLLSPFLQQCLCCRRVRQHVESSKCRDGQFQKTITAREVQFALPRLRLTNGIQPATQDFFDGNNRNKLIGQRNRGCSLHSRLMPQQDQAQDVSVERDHSTTSASRSRYASSQMSASVGSSRNIPARCVTPPAVSSTGNNSPACTRRRISASNATTASVRVWRTKVICGIPGTEAE